MYQCEEFSVVLDPFYRKISCIFLNEMKYKQEETLFETLYLHLQEEYSLFLPRKPCPRSWRTYCTSWFRASNWEDVPLLDQIDRKIFSVRNLYTFLGESSFESSESVQEQCSVASRVALIQCREQAQQFRLPSSNGLIELPQGTLAFLSSKEQ